MAGSETSEGSVVDKEAMTVAVLAGEKGCWVEGGGGREARRRAWVRMLARTTARWSSRFLMIVLTVSSCVVGRGAPGCILGKGTMIALAMILGSPPSSGGIGRPAMVDALSCCPILCCKSLWKWGLNPPKNIVFFALHTTISNFDRFNHLTA
ncbi:hypothetical protein BJ546DRAFT_1019103, partial [Cryomyces antarcticus]